MFDQFTFIFALLSAIGSGLIAGVFFAFSTFVIRALAKLPANEAIAAMQSINIVVINPAFMLVFIGTVFTCVAAGVLGIMKWDRPGSIWMIAGVLLYVVGTVGVTIAFNVPLNDALAKASATDPASVQQWTDYVNRWTMWNHIRTIAAVAALIAFIMSLRSISTTLPQL